MNRRTAVALLLLASAAIIAAYCAVARGVEIVPATDGPIPPWKMLRLDITGVDVEQLKTAAVHLWPRETAEVQAGYGWDGKPYLIFQGTSAGSYWLSVCVPVDGGLESAEITVEVGGSGPQPSPPEPDPGPTPPPDPSPADWLLRLRNFVAEEAAKAMPGKGAEAKRWAASIRDVIGQSEGMSPIQFRVALKAAGTEALGYERMIEWDDKFDNPILTPKIKSLLTEHDLTTVKMLLPVWRAVADGLDAMKEAPVSIAAPNVELVCFGAAWCEPCNQMRPTRDALRTAGWKVGYVDVDKPGTWTAWHESKASSVPHLVVLVDGSPWEHVTGVKSAGYLVDWLRRAQNVWRVNHGLEPVPFEAFGDTTMTDPVDREFFYREHWRMTPGTCGMMGCTAHGGGWQKVLERTQ